MLAPCLHPVSHYSAALAEALLPGPGPLHISHPLPAPHPPYLHTYLAPGHLPPAPAPPALPLLCHWIPDPAGHQPALSHPLTPSTHITHSSYHLITQPFVQATPVLAPGSYTPSTRGCTPCPAAAAAAMSHLSQPYCYSYCYMVGRTKPGGVQT
jgi:hypothetical protein